MGTLGFHVSSPTRFPEEILTKNKLKISSNMKISPFCLLNCLIPSTSTLLPKLLVSEAYTYGPGCMN